MAKVYHRADALGEGAFGSVCKAFDDNGDVYALKLCEEDDDETLSQETLREVSTLKMFAREDMQAASQGTIIKLVDVFVNEAGKLAVVLPLLHITLASAIEQSLIPKRSRLKAAHSILTACAVMHANGFIHRDIKGENLLFKDPTMETVVLIDFSFSKPIGNGSTETLSHTGDVGTTKYIAPEVYQSKPYSFSADCWSAGVCLLEMFTNTLIDASRDKEAFNLVAKAKEALPDERPKIKALLKGLLEPVPTERLSAMHALKKEPLSTKLVPPEMAQHLDVVPVPVRPPTTGVSKRKQRKLSKKANKKNMKDTSIATCIRKAFDELEFENAATLSAANAFWTKVQAHDEPTCVQDLKPEYCVLLAAKVYEESFYDLDELEEEEYLDGFTREEYMEAELKLFRIVDYCLYSYKATGS